MCYKGGTRFDLIRLHCEFRARDSIHFPAGKAANILRGAFGLALERVAGAAEYARIFRPRAPGTGPSGLFDRPRPFVFRARHLDGVTTPPGESFHFQLNVFTLDQSALDAIRSAFAEAARQGIGPGRGRAEMHEAAAPERVSLNLAPAPHAPPRVRVDFLTPTELKHEGTIAERPEFAILYARVRDRIGTLRELYGPGPLEIDFAGAGTRAANVRMPFCELRRIDAERRSSRTGQSHSIGGFTGCAEYEGEMAEFLPYLEAAHWTGVGRQAVWGKGEISIYPAGPT